MEHLGVCLYVQRPWAGWSFETHFYHTAQEEDLHCFTGLMSLCSTMAGIFSLKCTLYNLFHRWPVKSTWDPTVLLVRELDRWRPAVMWPSKLSCAIRIVSVISEEGSDPLVCRPKNHLHNLSVTLPKTSCRHTAMRIKFRIYILTQIVWVLTEKYH